MKLIGILFIFLGTTIFGFYSSYKSIYRRNDLLEIKRALLILNSEIKILSTSLKEALVFINNSIKNPVRNIFFVFENLLEEKRGEELLFIWKEALIKGSKYTYFTKDDIDKFEALGRVIGGYDKILNSECINMILEYIDTSIKHIENEKFKKIKMNQSLGILGGLILIILLI